MCERMYEYPACMSAMVPASLRVLFEPRTRTPVPSHCHSTDSSDLRAERGKKDHRDEEEETKRTGVVNERIGRMSDGLCKTERGSGGSSPNQSPEVAPSPLIFTS